MKTVFSKAIKTITCLSLALGLALSASLVSASFGYVEEAQAAGKVNKCFSIDKSGGTQSSTGKYITIKGTVKDQDGEALKGVDLSAAAGTYAAIDYGILHAFSQPIDLSPYKKHRDKCAVHVKSDSKGKFILKVPITRNNTSYLRKDVSMINFGVFGTQKKVFSDSIRGDDWFKFEKSIKAGKVYNLNVTTIENFGYTSKPFKSQTKLEKIRDVNQDRIYDIVQVKYAFKIKKAK